jgi:ABC-type Mn2+/Zn2+ transport system permease subunit
MDALLEILSPHFLLRNSMYASILIGFACPLVGVYMVLRRLLLLGIALPQISSTGVGVALSLPLWLNLQISEHASHTALGEHILAFVGSTVFSLVAILILTWLEQRGRGWPEARLSTTYVVAGALSILLLTVNRFGDAASLDLLKGEISSISNFDLVSTAISLAAVLLVLGLFHNELLLVSFDRTLAMILGKKVIFWDAVMYLLIGLTVSVAVLSVGPLITFGFLLLPPLTVRLFAQTMRQFAIMASVVGGVTSSIGFYVAFTWDLPIGPTDVLLLGVIYLLAFIAKAISQMLTKIIGQR